MRKIDNGRSKWINALYKRKKEKLIKEDKAYAAQLAIWAKDRAPIVKDLRKVGFDVQDHWELVYAKNSYYEAIPILLSHLKNTYLPPNKEGILRALLGKGCERYIPFGKILAIYNNTEPGDAGTQDYLYAYVICNAMTINDIEKIIPFLSDPKREDVVVSAFIKQGLCKWRSADKAKKVLQKTKGLLEALAEKHPAQIVKDSAKEALTTLQESQKIKKKTDS